MMRPFRKPYLKKKVKCSCQISPIKEMQNIKGISSKVNRFICSKFVGGEVEMRSKVIARAKEASLKFSNLPGSSPRKQNSLLSPT